MALSKRQVLLLLLAVSSSLAVLICSCEAAAKAKGASDASTAAEPNGLVRDYKGSYGYDREYHGGGYPEYYRRPPSYGNPPPPYYGPPHYGGGYYNPGFDGHYHTGPYPDDYSGPREYFGPGYNPGYGYDGPGYGYEYDGPGYGNYGPPPNYYGGHDGDQSEYSGPVSVGRANQRLARKDPNGTTPPPSGPLRHVMPRRGGEQEQQPGAMQVCAANPAYAPVGPSSTVCKFNQILKDGSISRGTAWFIAPNLMVTAGHCVSNGGDQRYNLNPANPGNICCNPNPDNSCPNNSLFNVLAWVTIKGWWELGEGRGGTNNDGAVLLVEPATNSNIAPVPLSTTTFNGRSLPALRITTSGFPCADDRFQGCDLASGINDNCTALRGYTLPSAALPILDSNNADGNELIYTGSSCGGHSGGPLSAPNDNVDAFGILVNGPTPNCTLDGSTSGSTYSQIVDKTQRFGVHLARLVEAVTAPAGQA